VRVTLWYFAKRGGRLIVAMRGDAPAGTAFCPHGDDRLRESLR
jgi:hypothetical protein